MFIAFFRAGVANIRTQLANSVGMFTFEAHEL
jgi:hypothetical protein